MSRCSSYSGRSKDGWIHTFKKPLARRVNQVRDACRFINHLHARSLEICLDTGDSDVSGNIIMDTTTILLRIPTFRVHAMSPHAIIHQKQKSAACTWAKILSLHRWHRVHIRDHPLQNGQCSTTSKIIRVCRLFWWINRPPGAIPWP